MITPLRHPLTSLRGSLAEPRYWTWAALICALLACGVLSWLHRVQRDEMDRATAAVETVRRARIDLAKGALRLRSAPSDSREALIFGEGVALTEQALEAMQSALAAGAASGGGETGNRREQEEFTRSRAEYRRWIAEWQAGRPDPLALRLAYGALERQCERIDDTQQASLHRLRISAQRKFLGATAGTGALLLLACGGVALAAREQARSLEKLRLATEAAGVDFLSEELNERRLSWWRGRVTGTGRGAAPWRFADLVARALTGEDREALITTRTAALASAGGAHTEVRLRGGDGQEVWLLVRLVRQTDSAGRPVRLAGVLVDVTARKQESMARGEVEARFRRLFKGVPVGLILSRRDGVVVDINDRAVALLGYSSADIARVEEWWRMAYPDPTYRARVQAQWTRDVEAAAAAGTDIPLREYRVRTKAGQDRLLEISGAIFQGEILVVFQDITERRQAEEQKRFHEQLLEETGRIAQIGGWSFDAVTGEGFWTDEVARIHDLDPAVQPTREMGLSFYAEASRPRIAAAIEAAVTRGETYDLELELISARGLHKWVRTIGHPEVENGRVVRVRGSFQDITPLRRISESRERQRRRVEMLADISRRLVLNTTPDSLLRGIFSDLARELDVDVYANYLFDAATGRLRLDSAAGLTDAQMIDFAELQLGQSLCGLVAERRAPLVLPELAHVSLEQAKGIIALGVQAYVGQPLLANGQLVGTISFGSRRRTSFGAEDVQLIKAVADQVAAAVERGRLLRALKTSEERFRSVVENIGEVFWMTDVAKNAVEYVSPSFEAVWGRPCGDLLASMGVWPESIHPQDRDRVLTAARTKQALGTYDETYRIIRPDGAVRWVHDKAFPVIGPDGRVERLVGVAVDVTEARDMEERFLRAQRMEAIGTLASGIAHDLNNILAPMLMVTGLFRDKLTAPQDQAMLLMIERSARRGAGIIGQLLTFSRGLEGAKGTLQPRLFLKEIAHLMAETLPRDIDIRVEVPADLGTVVADATQLHQVLLNLCINARDAMPQGGQLVLSGANVQLDEAATRHFAPAKPGPYVMMSVRDSGAGIPPEIITRIFDPFFTTKEIGKGTGLGLATVMGIVRGHHGVIAVESEPGRGAEFRVYLPVGAAAESVAPPVHPGPEIRGQGELILLVDDEEVIRRATGQVLESSGFRVVTAANGEEAVRIFTARRAGIRLVVTDVMMPVMDGLTLARALHVLEPTLPIIACSGLDQQDRSEEFARHGVVALLGKPLSVATLLEAVRKALQPVRRDPVGAPDAGRL